LEGRVGEVVGSTHF